MRIAIISPAYPLRGGIAQYTSMLANELHLRGHQVLIVNFTRQYPRMLFAGKTQEDLDETFKIKSAKRLDTLNPVTWWRAAQEINDWKADLVLFQWWLPYFGLCYSSIAKKIDARKAAICHNVVPHEVRFLDVFMTYMLFEKIDHFIVQSQSVADELKVIKKDAKYSLCYHPVVGKFGDEIEREQARGMLNIKHDKVILFFGHIRKYKGLDILLEAFKQFISQGKGVALVIAGEFYSDTDEELLKMFMRNICFGRQVYLFPGFVKNEDIYKFFSAADVVVLPYKSGSQSGIIQLAYHFNRPVIVSNVGGLAEYVDQQKTGYVIRPESAGELRAAFEYFFLLHGSRNEPDYRTFIGEKKKRFSWTKMCETIEGIWQIKTQNL